MNTKRTKLSAKDRKVLKKVYDALEKITLPTTWSSEGVRGSYHAVKIGVTKQRDARQASFGMTKYRGNLQVSKYAKKYPHVMELFKEFMDSHHPEIVFKNVYVNRNTVAKEHLDSKNAGESLLVGLGKYTGGKTVLYTPEGKAKKYSIRTHSLIFNGSEIKHSSEPFKGTRYSLVFFS